MSQLAPLETLGSYNSVQNNAPQMSLNHDDYSVNISVVQTDVNATINRCNYHEDLSLGFPVRPSSFG